MGIKTNIVINQGSSFTENFELENGDDETYSTSGQTASGTMKKWYTSESGTSFTVTLTDGNLSLSLTADQTKALEPGRYVYDVVLVNTSDNTVSRPIEGIATVTPGVTLL